MNATTIRKAGLVLYGVYFVSLFTARFVSYFVLEALWPDEYATADELDESREAAQFQRSSPVA